MTFGFQSFFSHGGGKKCCSLLEAVLSLFRIFARVSVMVKVEEGQRCELEIEYAAYINGCQSNERLGSVVAGKTVARNGR